MEGGLQWLTVESPGAASKPRTKPRDHMHRCAVSQSARNSGANMEDLGNL